MSTFPNSNHASQTLSPMSMFLCTTTDHRDKQPNPLPHWKAFQITEFRRMAPLNSWSNGKTLPTQWSPGSPWTSSSSGETICTTTTLPNEAWTASRCEPLGKRPASPLANKFHNLGSSPRVTSSPVLSSQNPAQTYQARISSRSVKPDCKQYRYSSISLYSMHASNCLYVIT